MYASSRSLGFRLSGNTIRRPKYFLLHFHTTAVQGTMAHSTRTYSEALTLLDTLQSNREIVSQVQSSNRDMNQDAIPEMLAWVRKAGYAVTDFNKLKVIHVAGTKGKGSVCAIVGSILQQYRYSSGCSGAITVTSKKKDVETNCIRRPEGLGKIGLYTSPHLIDVRERIRIDNVPISESLFAHHFFSLWDRFSASAAAAGHPDPASPATKPGFFRYLTIMALQVFLHEGVESAIMECGIGGEYDSTNILPKEAKTVTAITKLGIDHVGMLGDTVEKIAWHKAGIMVEGAPCFTVPQVEGATRVLEERAKEKGATLHVVERWKNFVNWGDRWNKGDIESRKVVEINLAGDFQKDNASLAVAVASAHLQKLGYGDDFSTGGELPIEFLRGLKEVQLEGRCQFIDEGMINWYVDGAHTLDSIAETAKWFATHLDSRGADSMLIFNQQARDAAALVTALHSDMVEFAPCEGVFRNAAFCTNNPYKVAPKEQDPGFSVVTDNLEVQRMAAAAWKKCELHRQVHVYASIEEAIAKAREIAAEKDRNDVLHVLVTGSLHLVGGFLKVLKNEEERAQ